MAWADLLPWVNFSIWHSLFAVTAVAAAYGRLQMSQRQPKQEGLFHVSGLPLVGSTVTFARYGIDLLAWAHQRAAHAFQVSLMGRTYVFMTSPAAVGLFMQLPSSVLALQPAVAPFTQKCFGLSSSMWHNGEAIPAHALRQLLLPNKVASMANSMAQALMDLSPAYLAPTNSAVHTDLAQAIPRWVMHATVVVLFGHLFVGLTDIGKLLDTFEAFDALFEVRAGSLS